MSGPLRVSLIVAAAALALGVAVVAGVLVFAHLAIREIHPPLPAVAELASAFEEAADLPVRVSYINTASQAMPRSGVLEPSLDPDPDAPYVMSMASFVIEWADGRIFLIDLGMDREASIAFGAPSEAVVGADPIQPHADVAAALGADRKRVAGTAFTHLHSDHTNGALALCAALGSASPKIPSFRTRLQATESNYTTRPALDQLKQADCLELVDLAGEAGGAPLRAVPGFPGLGIVATGGHTPGSQLFVARVAGKEGTRTWIFTGDLVNHVEGVRSNVPKPRLYSLFVVPEDTERLDALRRYLRELWQQPGVGLLVSHDQLQLESSGIEAW